jgi:hypothetical protein
MMPDRWRALSQICSHRRREAEVVLPCRLIAAPLRKWTGPLLGTFLVGHQNSPVFFFRRIAVGVDLFVFVLMRRIGRRPVHLRLLRAPLVGRLVLVEADLEKIDGVDKLYGALKGQPVDALLANAGRGLGKGFLDQQFDAVRHVIDTNITGTVYLLQKIGRHMRARGLGRILITGSIAGFMPGTYQAVYNGTKAFLDSFSFALRNSRTRASPSPASCRERPRRISSSGRTCSIRRRAIAFERQQVRSVVILAQHL